MIRSRPKATGTNPTPAQLMQREKFALAIKFQNSLRTMQTRLYGNNSGVRSRVNLAAKHLLTEVVGEQSGQAVLVMEKVLVTKGELLGFENLKATPLTGGDLEFSWTDNSKGTLGLPTDIFSAAVYEEESGTFQVKEGPEVRADGSAAMQLPARWIGKKVHIYAFFQNQEQQSACTSVYVGSLTVL